MKNRYTLVDYGDANIIEVILFEIWFKFLEFTDRFK